MTRQCMLFAMLVLFTPSARAEPATNLGARIQAIMAPWNRRDAPGCSVAVVRDGKLVHRRGYGLADLEHRVPNTPDTVFEIGSTSKQFTAASTFLLAAEGKIDLDRDVRAYLPELPAYGDGQIITARRLLSHTSGLRDYGLLMTLAGRFDDRVRPDDVLEMLARQRSLEFKPGEHLIYRNTGYVVLSQVIERIAGMSFARYASERIFTPLGMRNTHIHEDVTQVVPGRAFGYSRRGDGSWHIEPTVWNTVGDASVYTNVLDLARWDANFSQPEVGGPQLLERLHTPATLNSGRKLHFAGGLMLGTYRGLPTVSHAGAYPGYRAQLLRFPSQRTSVIVLCNAEPASAVALAESIADVALEGRFPSLPPVTTAAATLTPAQLDTWIGRYRDGSRGEVLEIMRSNDHLSVAGAAAEKLVPSDPQTFKSGRPPIEFTYRFEGAPPNRRLTRTSDSPLSTLAFEAVFQEDKALVPATVDANAYAGRYYSVELDVEWRIVRSGGDLRLRGRGVDAPLRGLSKERLLADSVGILEFTRNGRAVGGFRLRPNGSLVGIPFEKR